MKTKALCATLPSYGRWQHSPHLVVHELLAFSMD